jgi:hypothetical protein
VDTNAAVADRQRRLVEAGTGHQSGHVQPTVVLADRAVMRMRGCMPGSIWSISPDDLLGLAPRDLCFP